MYQRNKNTTNYGIEYDEIFSAIFIDDLRDLCKTANHGNNKTT